MDEQTLIPYCTSDLVAVVSNGSGTDELYTLSSDPYELENEISNPSHATTLTELQADLATLLAE